MSADRFTQAHARAAHWGVAAKACAVGLGSAAAGANIGFLYATEEFGPHLSSILTFLRGTTGIAHWVGGAAPGLCAGDEEIRDGGALTVMVGTLPKGHFHVFAGDPGAWPAEHFPSVGLVHGDPRDPGLPDTVEEVAAAAGFLVGGLLSTAGPPVQLADQVMAGGLAGVLMDGGIDILTGMTQGCSPIGPVHTVTEAWDGVVMALDGHPAIEALRRDVGELLARDLRRVAGYIHVGLPVAEGDDHDYLVRSLVGIDPAHGWLAIGGQVAEGDRLMFVRRDANSARADMTRMLDGIKARLDNRPIRAGFYVSCVGRGEHMFGVPGAETALLRRELGDFPLIGFFANGEICRDRLYGFTGVLALLPGNGK